MTSIPKTLAQYRAEAAKEPFKLPLDDDKVLEIPPPSGNTLLDLDEAFTTKAVLKLLCGDRYDEFVAAIGEENSGVLMAVGKDMQRHFGLGGWSASST